MVKVRFPIHSLHAAVVVGFSDYVWWQVALEEVVLEPIRVQQWTPPVDLHLPPLLALRFTSGVGF